MKTIPVLIVDDEAMFTKLAISQLAQAREVFFEPLAVAGLPQAMQALQERRFAVVLLDLKLPGVKGLDGLRQIRNRAPDTPVLMLTNTADEELAMKTIRHGAQDYLLKQEMSPALLERSIRYAMERSATTVALQRSNEALLVQKELYQNLMALAQATARYPTLDATLENALRAATTVTGATLGSLTLVDEQLTVLRSLNILNGVSHPPEPSAIQLAMRSGLAGWTARNRQPARIGDTEQDPRWLHIPNQVYPVRSAISAPVLANGDLLGVMVLAHPEVDHFTIDQMEWMVSAVDYLSLALQNARMFEELQRARDAAEQAARAKSVFLSNVSHELLTPLSVVIGYSELLIEQLENVISERELANLRQVNTSANQLLGMVNDLLDLSRLEAGHVFINSTPFDPPALAQELAEKSQQLAARKGNLFEVVVDPGAARLVSDRQRVRQILENLIDNAAKFTENGQIRLEVFPTERNVTDWVCFSVVDSGMGIAPDDLAQLFGPFQQVDTSLARRTGGVGLGLALCRRLSAMLGGEITVQSEPGKGSTFSLLLPARWE
jgi:signal transduction histidine kinase